MIAYYTELSGLPVSMRFVLETYEGMQVIDSNMPLSFIEEDPTTRTGVVIETSFL